MTFLNSFFRNKPWSTKMQVKLRPMALFKSVAHTEESTPPLSPNITLSLPTCCRMLSTVLSMNDAGLHVCLLPQISTTKFFNKVVPCVVWNTSGWNWTAHVGFFSLAYAAYFTSPVLAITWQSLGMAVMVSPWLIHTCDCGWKPLNSGLVASNFSKRARPYSRVPVLSTFPPLVNEMNWAP